MKASVIIPVWNGQQYLPECLDALLAQDYPDFEVIVVDNASADGSANLVADRYPQVRLIRNQSNRGFAGGCNVGLRAATGDVLVLLNQDTVVQPGWLHALVRELEKPEVGIAGCKILYPDGKTIQHAGAWIEWPLGISHHYGQGEEDKGQWDEPRQVEYVTGTAMAFRRDVLENVGLMDEGFWPGYFEDPDFCFRAREAKYEIRYVPDAVVLHVEGGSTSDPVERSHFYERGRLRFVLKHTHPRRFLEEFVPAEKSRALALQTPYGNTVRLAYLEAIPMAARILPQRWNTDEQTMEAVLLALQYLYHFPVFQTPVEAGKGRETKELPILREFEFRSSVPVIGPLIARLREACYNIATRWAIRYLIQQQTAINREIERELETFNRELETFNRELETFNRELDMKIYSLEHRLTRSSASLAREIARLIQELETLQQCIKEAKGQ